MKRNTDNMEIKRRSTFAILFYINRTKVRKDGTCQLLCKISIDAKWEQIGTKVSVNPAIWNPEKGRADGRSENAITVNRAIDDLTKEIKEHYRRIKNSLGFITAEQVKNAVMGVGQKPLTLLALFREHNEEFKKRIGVDRIKESYDSYLRSYKHLSAFVQEKRGVEDVLLRSLDRVFYDDFELFLRTDRNLSPKQIQYGRHQGRIQPLGFRPFQIGRQPVSRMVCRRRCRLWLFLYPRHALESGVGDRHRICLYQIRPLRMYRLWRTARDGQNPPLCRTHKGSRQLDLRILKPELL